MPPWTEEPESSDRNGGSEHGVSEKSLRTSSPCERARLWLAKYQPGCRSTAGHPPLTRRILLRFQAPQPTIVQKLKWVRRGFRKACFAPAEPAWHAGHAVEKQRPVKATDAGSNPAWTASTLEVPLSSDRKSSRSITGRSLVQSQQRQPLALQQNGNYANCARFAERNIRVAAHMVNQVERARRRYGSDDKRRVMCTMRPPPSKINGGLGVVTAHRDVNARAPV